MSYLIDGHNLIPHIRGLSLSMVDDEEQLIALLMAFCRKRHTRADCYFDNALPGLPPTQRHGRVTVHFIRAGSTADEAILEKLSKLKGDARNWFVVSSDQRVQMGAREVHAQVMAAEAFASMLEDVLRNTKSNEKPEETVLGPEEVSEWLRLFRKGSTKNHK